MSKQRDYLQIVGPHRFMVGGRFFPDSGNQPTYADDDDHLGWSVAWTSTGLFTVTIKGVRTCRLMNFVGLPGLQISAESDLKPEWGAYVAPTATADATVQIRIVDISSTAVADVTANANNAIHWAAIFSSTKVRNT